MQSRVKILQTNIVAYVLLAELTELLYSTFAWLFLPPDDIWIYENVGQTVQFDPVRGYTLARTPSRFARISNGEIEYVGRFSGNARGLCDQTVVLTGVTTASLVQYEMRLKPEGDPFMVGG